MRVLIVGAGLCGLSVAKALQNINVYPDIIEKDGQIRSDGAGIAIPANGSWALNQLGIELDSKALPIRSMQFTDELGNLLAQEEIDSIHAEGAQFYSLNRHELIKRLSSCLDKRMRVQTFTTLRRFSEEKGQVKAEFSNGEEKFYDLVLGCDGVHSSLRRQVHPQEIPQFLGLLVWRAVIKAPEAVAMPVYMLGSDRLVLLYPLANNQIYVYGHIFQPKKNFPSETFSQVFSCFGGLVPQILQAIDRQNPRFYIHHMESSHSVRFKLGGFSRALLVGDAAHAAGPMLQNGAAQAFEDAYVIQELLKEQRGEREIGSLLDSFEKRRFARAQSVFALSNAKIQAISNPEGIQERNEAIRKFGAPNILGFKAIMRQNP